MKYNVTCFVVFIAIFFQLGSFLFFQRNEIFEKNYHEKYPQLYKSYYSSQYVKKDHPSIIPDNALEAFAGGEFLKGINPILIVHDQPPLGRYIISLSILSFDNASTIPLFLYLTSLIGLILIAKNVFNNFLLGLIPVGIFVNQSLFLNELKLTPTLEPIQFPFIVFSLFFFAKGFKEKKDTPWFILTSIMIGFVISIRFFSLGVALVTSMLVVLLFIKKMNKKTLYFLLSLLLSLFILISSYSVTIINGYSVLQIFGIQKYILLYHKSKFVLPFTFWDLLMLNRWHTWWGNYTIASDTNWSILWPISTIFSFIRIIALPLKGNLNASEIVISSWVLIYMIFLSIGYSSTRYFLPLIPFLYILGFAGLKYLFSELYVKAIKK